MSDTLEIAAPEKPVAVDAPGVRSVLATCEDAKQKGLSLVAGLCWRYHHGMREIFEPVADEFCTRRAPAVVAAPSELNVTAGATVMREEFSSVRQPEASVPGPV